ncbi:MAG: hypothetical protein OXB98_23125 [Bryobacterales bacterium]|nr:hypothetical protein [Bryobacterales bacterium]
MSRPRNTEPQANGALARALGHSHHKSAPDIGLSKVPITEAFSLRTNLKAGIADDELDGHHKRQPDYESGDVPDGVEERAEWTGTHGGEPKNPCG